MLTTDDSRSEMFIEVKC